MFELYIYLFCSMNFAILKCFKRTHKKYYSRVNRCYIFQEDLLLPMTLFISTKYSSLNCINICAVDISIKISQSLNVLKQLPRHWWLYIFASYSTEILDCWFTFKLGINKSHLLQFKQSWKCTLTCRTLMILGLSLYQVVQLYIIDYILIFFLSKPINSVVLIAC